MLAPSAPQYYFNILVTSVLWGKFILENYVILSPQFIRWKRETKQRVMNVNMSVISTNWLYPGET